MSAKLIVKGVLKSLFREPAPDTPVFVKNADDYRLDRSKLQDAFIGKPRATPWYTQERLESDGVVGIYKVGRHFDLGGQ